MHKQKRLMSIMLIMCIVLTLLSAAALAADKNFHDEDVTWLGAASEYPKTLAAFFDNGLRKVPVGDGIAPNGSLINPKYGLVDRYGAWQAQPIYDEIEAYYMTKDGETNRNKATETIFVDGYVQATRGGKMGLLDRTGREVIPCKYDAVGLPSEGVSRVYVKKSQSTSYIGYWNLDTGREIVAPDKYVVAFNYAQASGDIWSVNSNMVGGKEYFAAYDFNGGYALVPTGQTEKVTTVHISGIYCKPETYNENPQSKHTVTRTLVFAQIIDKNGKEILPGAFAYLVGGYMHYYPQAGPYLVYHEVKAQMLQMRTDNGDDVMYKSHLAGGVVGPKGIVVPAQYHGGIVGNSAVGWKPIDADIQIIPEHSLVLTDKCANTSIKESAARRGAVNFSNKTIIPFDSVRSYDAAHQVILAWNYIYRLDGTKVPNIDAKTTNIKNGYIEVSKTDPVNGYVRVAETFNSYDYNVEAVSTAKFVSIKTGAVYSHQNLQGSDYSPVSTKNTVWVNKGDAEEPRWGLVNLQGEVLVPFEYEDVWSGDGWIKADGGYATINKNDQWGMVDTTGKVLLPCHYRSISAPESGYQVIVDYETRKYGLTATYLTMGTINRGLFASTHGDNFGPDGKIVFPRTETRTFYDRGAAGNSAGTGYDLTLIVKDGKLGCVNASRLARDGRLPAAPRVKAGMFEVRISGTSGSSGAGEVLQTGNYYLQIYGKYVYPVKAGSTYWLELSNKKPDQPYTVKLIANSEKLGPQYTITYQGTYICLISSKDGAQLQSSAIPYMWRINKYVAFCTIRDYYNQKLIVNASGQKRDNGTKVIVWSSTGSAPDNAKIVFIKG